MKKLIHLMSLMLTFSVNAQTKLEKRVTNELESLLTDLENSTRIILGTAGSIDNSDSVAAMKDFKDHVKFNTKCFSDSVKSMAKTTINTLKPYYNQKETLITTNNTHTQAYKNLLEDISKVKENLEAKLGKEYNLAYKKLLNLAIAKNSRGWDSCHEEYLAGGISYVDVKFYKGWSRYGSAPKYVGAMFSYQSRSEEYIWSKKRPKTSKSEMRAAYHKKAGKRLIGVRKCQSDLCAVDLMKDVLADYLIEIERSVKRSLKFEAVKIPSPKTSVSASTHASKIADLIDIHAKSLSSVIIR